jgi:thiol-disulfide isomerase/thioredoxin
VSGAIWGVAWNYAPEDRGTGFDVCSWPPGLRLYFCSFAGVGVRSARCAALILAFAAQSAAFESAVGDPLNNYPAAAPTASISKLVPTSADLKPPIVLADLAGSVIRLSDYRGGVLFVHFFATWCEPCREELPALQRLRDRADGSPAVVAISVGEPELRVRRFFADSSIDLPVLLDTDSAAAKAWGVYALPTTYVLDAGLTPRLVVEGDFDWDSLDLKALLKELSTPALGSAAGDRQTVTAQAGG